MSYLGTFSACFLALVAFKFVEPWLDAMRDKVMGWDKEVMGWDKEQSNG